MMSNTLEPMEMDPSLDEQPRPGAPIRSPIRTMMDAGIRDEMPPIGGISAVLPPLHRYVAVRNMGLGGAQDIRIPFDDMLELA